MSSALFLTEQNVRSWPKADVGEVYFYVCFQGVKRKSSHMLMKGSIISAGEGNRNAAREAKVAITNVVSIGAARTSEVAIVALLSNGFQRPPAGFNQTTPNNNCANTSRDCKEQEYHCDRGIG